MKVSVIIALAQMSLGLICKGLNAWHFRDLSEAIVTLLQMIVLWGIVGLMDAMIVAKWLSGKDVSIIAQMINNVLHSGEIVAGV
jgi:hypothetical protein